MFSIAVVDDDPAERKSVAECLDYFRARSGNEYMLTEYASTETFLMEYERGTFDIVLMDIEFMGGQDGMEAAVKLRELDENVILMFVTKMAQMAIRGYEVDALDFIVKPLEKSSFFLKLSRAVRRVSSNPEQTVSLRCEGEMVSLRKNLIVYLEVQGHSVIWHSREGDFREYLSLSAAEKKLNDPAFEKCDRGALVNMRFVTRIKQNSCVVGGVELPLARERRVSFKKAYADYLSGIKR